MSVAEINRAAFSLPSVTSWYGRQWNVLSPDEQAALNWIVANRPKVRDLLDLGVGAGRTTPPLRAITINYTGLDFSKEMVEIARQRHSGTDFRVGDARDLKIFPDSSFDVVFFSYNGVDYVDHKGRMMIFGEVHRVLRPDGVFAFSSHNRRARKASIWYDPDKPIVRQLGQFARTLMFFPLVVTAEIRHLRFRHMETRTTEYEIRNDIGHGYRMLTYYISTVAQVRQLKTAGFSNIAVFDTAGHQLDTLEVLSEKSASHWLCYTGTKV